MISQILLAAGLSSRMKRLKPLLDFGGRPLLDHLLAECRQSQVDHIMVVLGHQRDRIRKAVDFSGVQVIDNPAYREGQTGSLQSALRALPARTEAFLNLPVDHPLVTRYDIDALVTAYRDCQEGARILVPVFRGQPGKPVLFDISLREEILALDLQQPVQGILEKFRQVVRQIPIENPYTMKDMDTPGDYQECLGIFRQRSGETPP